MTGRSKIRLAFIAFVIPSAVAACGLYTPDKDPFTSNAPVAPDHKFSRQGSYESGLVDHVTCEISRGLAETVKQWPGIPHLGSDWGTAVTLSMTVEDQTGLSPGVTFMQPFHNVVFPFRTGGNVTSPQSFSFSIGGTASANALRSEMIQYTFKNRDAIKFSECYNTGSGVLIDGDLKIKEFIFDKAQIIAAGNGLWYPGATLPFNAWTEEITFVAAYGATATPTWKLARISANASSNLVVSERTNTNDLIITLGPIDPCSLPKWSRPKQPDGKTDLVCSSDTSGPRNPPLSLTAAAMNQHNARVSANAIAVSVSGQSH
jgi:hypothetical protein